MNKTYCYVTTLVILFKLTFCSFAQSSDIIIKTERNSDNSVDFNYEKNVYGTFNIFVKLSNFSNCFVNDYKGSVSNSSGKLFSLKPEKATEPINFSYTYTFQRGQLNPQIDTSIVYTLPFRKGKKIRVSEAFLISERYGWNNFKSPKNFKCYNFNFNSTDTVLATRKGLVVKIVNNFETDTTKEYLFTDQRNTILIEHSDGTQAIYKGFQKNNIFVKEGDVVFPQTPLGMIAKYDAKEKYLLQYSVYSLIEDKNTNTSKTPSFTTYEYITPVFCTTTGNTKLACPAYYIVECSDGVLTREFSKKELKRFNSYKK